MSLAGAPLDLYVQLLALLAVFRKVLFQLLAVCVPVLCFGFACFAVFSACTMTARRTNISLAAHLDGENLSSDTLLHAKSSGPLSLASVAKHGATNIFDHFRSSCCCWCPRSRSNR